MTVREKSNPPREIVGKLPKTTPQEARNILQKGTSLITEEDRKMAASFLLQAQGARIDYQSMIAKALEYAHQRLKLEASDSELWDQITDTLTAAGIVNNNLEMYGLSIEGALLSDKV